jgi:serine/threonine protein kinase
VLLGVPFGAQIDVWSLGIVIVELCIAQPLFTGSTRSQQLSLLTSHLTNLPVKRFSGGNFCHLLRSIGCNAAGSSSNSSGISSSGGGWSVHVEKKKSGNLEADGDCLTFGDHFVDVHRLLLERVDGLPASLVNLIAVCLHPDPDLR